jgi:hypothetical protein
MEPSKLRPAELKDKLDRGEEIVFLDTRNEKAWAESDQKLRGARRVLVEKLSCRATNFGGGWSNKTDSC